MKKKNSGTTLVELIAVMAIMALVGSIIYTLFGTATKIYKKTHGQIKLQDDIRLLTTSLEDDIRVGYTGDVEIQATGDKVKFKPSSGSEFTSDFTTIGLTSPKVEYAFIKNSKYYAYVSYNVPSVTPVKRSITKYECSSTGVSKILKYTDLIETITCVKRPGNIVTSSPIVYMLEIKIKDKSGNEFLYNSTVNPRNR